MLAAMEGVAEVPSAYGTLLLQPPRELALSQLAERQQGVVSLDQLRSLGLDASTVRNRVAVGRLHRVHRGVYAVGHRLLTGRGEWMAAVLAYGPEAVLSHRSAAALWELLRDARSRIDVSVPRRAVRARPTICAHASLALRPADVTSRDGIPCTGVVRTLLDLAEAVPRRQLDAAVEQAEVLGLLDLRAIEEVLAGAPGHRGSGSLRATIAAGVEPALTASELEERFLAIAREAGLPRPEVNAWLAAGGDHLKVDFLWRSARLVVETDGHAFHGHRRAFERDRRRDQRLMLAGYQVVRCSWRQVAEEPGRLLDTISTLLGRRGRGAAERLR